MTKSIKAGTTSASLPRGGGAREKFARRQASGPPTFPSGRVDIWKIDLDVDEAEEGGTAPFSVLSPEEVTRANRFHFEKDRNHFTRCRSALRHLLGQYVSLRPDEIHFEYSANGKPQIIAPQNLRTLRFNVTHSAGIALIAIGSEHRLGIDIEKIRADVDTEALVERFFSERERASIRALPDELRVAGFYACWTRKEAFLKATGDGLSFPLADFSVTTDPGLEPALEEVRDRKEVHNTWLLKDIDVPYGYRAAVAVDQKAMRFEMYSWP